MGECSPPCFPGRGICDSKTLACLCGWEYGESDCSRTFAQILGTSYLTYTICSIILASVVFLFSGVTLEKSIEWKVTKLEKPQKFSLLFLVLGSFGKFVVCCDNTARIVYHSLTICGYRENKGDMPFLTPLYGFYIVAIFCSFVLVLLLWWHANILHLQLKDWTLDFHRKNLKYQHK